jgi:hypothetical protein
MSASASSSLTSPSRAHGPERVHRLRERDALDEPAHEEGLVPAQPLLELRPAPDLDLAMPSFFACATTRSLILAETLLPVMRVNLAGRPFGPVTTFSRSSSAFLNFKRAWLAHWKHSVSRVFRTAQMSRPASPPSWPYHAMVFHSNARAS